MLYTSIDNKKIKDLKKLNTKKYRDKTGLFLVEGRHLVLEAYKTGHLKELLLEKDELFPLSVPTNYLSNNVIHYITEVESPGTIFGVCEKPIFEESYGKRIVILDGIQDPGNLGTIIRSAVAFHVDMIILSPSTVDAYNSKVIRSSQGMIFHIPVVVKDLYEIIPKLQQQHYTIFGTKVTYGKNIKELENHEKFAIIMGNEGQGVEESILDLCDEYLYIEMNERCESLNVGVATSIILYELDK
ncbi:MAG: RNA methyltransferase [Bacilli bacterium]|nr:RNA methyltransferase [Bacilli bacterium]